jgi:hypothetical protein
MERDSQEHIGREVGSESVEHLVDQVENICLHERRRINLVNEPKIVSLKMELGVWADEERRIRERLRIAPPPGDRRSRRRSAWFAAGIALVLTVAGFFFSLLAFDPFRLGWKSYLYCVGIAIVSPYCIERCLEAWDCRRLITVLATCAGTAAIASLILLAVIRGNLFSQELRESETPVAVTDESQAVPQDDNHFYDQALPLLQLVMALLAAAIELGAGLALHDAKRFGTDSGEDSETVAKELIAVRMKIATVGSQIIEYANEGAVFEERFWRDFYRTLLTRSVKKAVSKFLGVSLLLFLAVGRPVFGGQKLDLVIAVDLTTSEAVSGHDGKSQFQSNMEAVGRLLATAPAGSRITVIGITENSFGQPYVLLSGTITDDPGYFGERLGSARRRLLDAWRKQTLQLAPNARSTDIFGAVLLASELFQQDASATRVLVIYSDMRNTTKSLNLERSIDAQTRLSALDGRGLIPNLHDVRVYVFGANAAGHDIDQWKDVKTFWTDYFAKTGATVSAYSVLDEVPSVGP